MSYLLRRITRATACGFAIAIFSLTIGSAWADIIDFETGFANNDRAGPVSTPANTVTFSVGANTTGPGTEDGYVVSDAFSGPVDSAIAGTFFLSDEPSGIGVALNYFMQFSSPVSGLNLNLYDFRVDGGGEAIGDTAALTVYSDSFGSAIGQDVFTIMGDEPDGNVETLAVASPAGQIRSASLIFTFACRPSCPGDIGNAIDNIQFDTISGPSPLLSKNFIDGPLREDGFGNLEPFDLDGDSIEDTGVIGIGLTYAQYYTEELTITNPGPSGDLNGLVFLDAVPQPFVPSPTGEDAADGVVDGACADLESCDGIVADATCPVAITAPMDGDIWPSALISIEADSLSDGEECTTRFHLVTQRASPGRGRGNAVFEPTECLSAEADSGAEVTDWVALNPGVKVLDATTNELVMGPIGSIQLRPIGCP